LRDRRSSSVSNRQTDLPVLRKVERHPPYNRHRSAETNFQKDLPLLRRVDRRPRQLF
jgi:hypothetical protein